MSQRTSQDISALMDGVNEGDIPAIGSYRLDLIP